MSKHLFGDQITFVQLTLRTLISVLETTDDPMNIESFEAVAHITLADVFGELDCWVLLRCWQCFRVFLNYFLLLLDCIG